MQEEELGLTARQKRFISEYIKKPVGGEAARNAGYSAKGADRAAVRLLNNPSIKKQIDEANVEIAKDARITKAKLLLEMEEGYNRCKKAKDEKGMQKWIDLLAKHADVDAYARNGSAKDSNAPKLPSNIFNILVQRIQAQKPKALEV